MNSLTISGVNGYLDENGTAFLKLEDVARGLGFTQIKGGVEYVRYERVNGYLADMGFPQLVGKEFIPENVFYRLAMKGETEAAERFQALVADEILPAIRKTGTYTVRKPMTQAEILAGMAQFNLEVERKLNALEEQAANTQHKLTAALDVFAAPPADNWRDEMNRIINGLCKEHGLNYQVFRGDLYSELELVASCNLVTRQTNLKKRLKSGGATYKDCQAVSKLDVIDRDAKLRPIFEGIVRRQQAKYAAAGHCHD